MSEFTSESRQPILSLVGGSKSEGYIGFDPEDEAYLRELAEQAARAMELWERQYGGIYEAVGGDPALLKTIISTLDAAEKTEGRKP